jgi:fermentation-respiration switch protein FrsA (DUF1100 family)
MLQSVIFIIITVWVSLCLLIYFFQDKLVYFPHNKVETTPTAISLQHEDITLTTNDGVQLNAWWIPHPDSRATLLFFHGNAGNISHRLNSIGIFHRLGLSVFIIDYRGYGNSTGTPSEQGTYIDAETAWNYLVNEKNIPPENIIIFGRSLGGAVATELAEKHTSAALIVESSFSSITDIGKHYYPYLPTRLLARIKYPTINRIPNIKSPVLIIHSIEDDIIPYENGKLLYEAAKEPKSFLQINGDHNNGFMISGEKYINGIDSFISNILGK